MQCHLHFLECNQKEGRQLKLVSQWRSVVHCSTSCIQKDGEEEFKKEVQRGFSSSPYASVNVQPLFNRPSNTKRGKMDALSFEKPSLHSFRNTYYHVTYRFALGPRVQNEHHKRVEYHRPRIVQDTPATLEFKRRFIVPSRKM